MRKLKNILFGVVAILAVIFVVMLFTNNNGVGLDALKANLSSVTTLAEETAAGADNVKGMMALGAGLVVGLGALGGAIAMGLAVAKAAEGISRQPEAEGKIRTTMMLGLVFIETVVIYALIVAILIIFVL